MQRGFLVFGGESMATGDILDDAWVFDLTNMGTGVCPWIELPSTGFARKSGGMGWDAANEKLIQVGGYTDSGSSEYATNTVMEASLEDLVDGTGWIATATLPDREYSTSDFSDTYGTGDDPYPSLDCNADVSRDVLCMEDEDWQAIEEAAGDAAAEAAYCDADGDFRKAVYSPTNVSVSPCDMEATCSVDGESLTRSTPYTAACADDPQCTMGELVAAYDSETAPGVAEAAVAVMPTSGETYVFAGTTGCSGGFCSDWNAVGALDGRVHNSTTNANVDQLFRVAGSAVVDVGAVHAGTIAESECPTSTSYGRRGAAGAITGAAWDHVSQRFTTGGAVVAVGGTRHQTLAAGLQHEIVCADAFGDDMQICDDYCVTLNGSWVQGDAVYADAGEGLVQGWDGIAVLDSAGTSWDLQGDPGPRMYAGASWFGDRQVLVWGGEADGIGLDDALVWDTSVGDRTWMAPSQPWGERVGGSVVYDAVSRTAYLYGGADSEKVYTYALEPLPADENATRLEGDVSDGVATALVQAGLSTTDGVNWTLSGGFESALACDSGQDCWADELSIIVATQVPSELDALTVHVTYSDNSDEYDLTAYDDWPYATGFSVIAVRLPRILTDTMDVDVEVSWEGPSFVATTFAECEDNDRLGNAVCAYTLGRDDSSTVEDERSTLAVLTAQPAVPESLVGDSIGIGTMYSLPIGWQGIAPGTPDATGAVFTGADHLHALGEPPYRNMILAGEGLAIEQTLTTASSQINVWLDGGIDPAASVSGAYLTATSGPESMQGDADWLEMTVASLPAWPVNHVVLRQSEAEEEAFATSGGGTSGQSWSGLTVGFAADSSGVPTQSLRATTVHEWAHQVLAFRRQPTQWHFNTASWVTEGAPELLSWMRIGDKPNLAGGWTATQYPYSVVSRLARATCDYEGDLEANSDDREVVYDFGAYTLSQLHFSYLAMGGSTSGFWSELESFYDTEDLVDSSAINSLISVSMGLPYFYTEWVAEGRIGTPLLALTAVDADVSGCVDTGDCEPATGVAQVVQIQGDQLSQANGCAFDTVEFHDVPYYFACESFEAVGSIAFDECQATLSTLLDETPYTISGAAEPLALTANSSLGPDLPWPAEVRLLSNDALLPGWVPLAGYSAAWSLGRIRGFRVCPRAEDMACLGDEDLDGYPLTSECDDFDATRNPAAAPLGYPVGSGIDDNNCDGW